MNLKQLIAGAAITAGLGAAALGLGAGLASAQPAPPGPGPVVVQPPRPDIGWQDRDAYDRAVTDHRPFQYQGQWVNPVFDGGHQAWGFWLGPISAPRGDRRAFAVGGIGAGDQCGIAGFVGAVS